MANGAGIGAGENPQFGGQNVSGAKINVTCDPGFSINGSLTQVSIEITIICALDGSITNPVTCEGLSSFQVLTHLCCFIFKEEAGSKLAPV